MDTFAHALKWKDTSVAGWENHGEDIFAPLDKTLLMPLAKTDDDNALKIAIGVLDGANKRPKKDLYAWLNANLSKDLIDRKLKSGDPIPIIIEDTLSMEK